MHVEMFALVLETEWIEKKESELYAFYCFYFKVLQLADTKEKVQDDGDGDGKQAVAWLNVLLLTLTGGYLIVFFFCGVLICLSKKAG